MHRWAPCSILQVFNFYYAPATGYLHWFVHMVIFTILLFPGTVMFWANSFTILAQVFDYLSTLLGDGYAAPAHPGTCPYVFSAGNMVYFVIRFESTDTWGVSSRQSVLMARVLFSTNPGSNPGRLLLFEHANGVSYPLGICPVPTTVCLKVHGPLPEL